MERKINLWEIIIRVVNEQKKLKLKVRNIFQFGKKKKPKNCFLTSTSEENRLVQNWQSWRTAGSRENWAHVLNWRFASRVSPEGSYYDDMRIWWAWKASSVLKSTAYPSGGPKSFSSTHQGQLQGTRSSRPASENFCSLEYWALPLHFCSNPGL